MHVALHSRLVGIRNVAIKPLLLNEHTCDTVRYSGVRCGAVFCAMSKSWLRGN